jgi:hypothetical protein
MIPNSALMGSCMAVESAMELGQTFFNSHPNNARTKTTLHMAQRILPLQKAFKTLKTR